MALCRIRGSLCTPKSSLSGFYDLVPHKLRLLSVAHASTGLPAPNPLSLAPLSPKPLMVMASAQAHQSCLSSQRHHFHSAGFSLQTSGVLDRTSLFSGRPFQQNGPYSVSSTLSGRAPGREPRLPLLTVAPKTPRFLQLRGSTSHRSADQTGSIYGQKATLREGWTDGWPAEGLTPSAIKASEESEDRAHGELEVLFVGSGTSEGIPRVSCLTSKETHCPVCWSATIPGNKNRRRNTSILIRHRPSPANATDDSEEPKHILIDVGKFFYHSALQWFPENNIRQLDAVLITHSHADSIGGLDDLRDWTNNVQSRIPIYVAPRDLKVMEKTHYYLVDPSGITKGTAVSMLDFIEMKEEPFDVCGLKVTPLPVWHGPGYRSLGFRIGNLCYLSDVSEIPEETYPLLEGCELLVLDGLRTDKSSATHFGIPEGLPSGVCS